MLDCGYQAFFDIIDMLLFEVATFLPNFVEIDTKISERHQFSQFKIAAAAMLTFGHHAFFDIIDVLLFERATFLPN